jgi:hypothetical protein
MICPSATFIFGIQGQAGGALDQLSLVCLELEATYTDGGYHVTIVASRVGGPAQGGSGGTPFHDVCPGDTIANGINFRAGAFIDAFAIECATLTPMP